MRRSPVLIFCVGALLSVGGWLARRPPAWIGADPLLHPFGSGLEEAGRSPTVPAEPRDQIPVDPAHPIDLSSADAEELRKLPGVGPVLAARMLVQRDSLGGLDDAAQLDAVPGIGPKLLERLLPLVRFPSAGTDSLRNP